MPAATTTTTAGGTTVTGVSGGAFGFLSSISLFGGPATSHGPAPTVTLPPGGSAAPVTASDPSDTAVYGPATIFSSGPITVSTQGTTASGSVTSSATVTNENTSQSEAFTASSIGSTCSASTTGLTASTNVTGGKVTLSQGTNFDSTADDTVQLIAANPAPNTTYTGNIENVGDHFKIVFNEQTVNGNTVTVSAMHMYLLGPIALGDLFVGQSTCGLTATAATGTGTANTLSRTGLETAATLALALDFLMVGWTMTRASESDRLTRRGRPLARP